MREIQFNDIRDIANTANITVTTVSYTSTYDEAITHTNRGIVRRAMAIEEIINWEFGLLQNENALQKSYIVEEL